MIRPTGTYCRDIARELRDTADEQVRCGQPLSEFLGDVLGFGYEPDIEAREADVISELAWLIDRPTCHVVKFERAAFISDGVAHRVFEFRCSNCGEEPWSDSESVTRFCPCCGAEVVR